jgi:predicted molibdopterin-dependent oxidoreductase YjgC
VRRAALPAGMRRGPRVTVTVDAQPIDCHLGETVAAVLIADGSPATRTTRLGSPRGVFCGMGVCFDCLVVVDGVPNTRACMTWVRDGMQISHQDGFAARDATSVTTEAQNGRRTGAAAPRG